MNDEILRSACFASLDVLCAQYGGRRALQSDLEKNGEPIVPNGLSLCSIHHRAFDQNLVGVSPDYRVHVSARLLEDEDGPMLELLKQSHTAAIALPARSVWQPDRERLAERFERFAVAG